MSFSGDTRAQSVQIGAVLLFATLIIGLSLYQATIVPSENQEIEFNAYEEASGDLIELRNTMLATGSGDGERGVTVKTGAQYPSRVFFTNPLQPAGTVETLSPDNVTLGNVEASNGELANVGEYLSLEGGTLNYTTRNVHFDPDYKELSAAPIIINNGLVYRNHSRPTPLSGQTLIRDNTITVQTVVGDLDATGFRSSITAVPVSAHTNSISVTNSTADPVTLTLPTQRNASEWETRLLGDETGNNVQSVQPGPRPGTVTLELAPGETYDLQISRIELVERNTDASADDPPTRYLVSETDRTLTTNSNGRVKLAVQARNTLNNPAANEPVTFSSTSGTFETESGTNLSQTATVRTNAEGNAVVYYNATDYIGNLNVNARLGTGGSVSGEKEVTYRVTNTVTSSGGGGGGSGEQAGRGLVILEDTGTDPNSDTFTFTIRNRGTNPINMTGYRLDYITKMASNGQLTDGPNSIVSVSFPDLGESRTGTATEGREPYFLSNSVQIPPGQSIDMEVTFDQSWSLGNKDALTISNAIYLEGGITTTYTTFHINN